jgi:N6-adenosine-specific RNA methylase IME4
MSCRKKYRTIVADPPWKYGVWGVGSKKSAFGKKYNEKEIPIPYETMTVEEIKALNVADLADENCELYLWTTQKYLPDAFEVLKAWGFRYCQTLTWCKTPMGNGQGGVYCPTTEFLILGRKGKMPKVKRINTTWWNVKRTNKHSKKPEFFQDLIETVSYPPRLEMFARRKRVGWDIWGNELENDVELETSANNGR